MFISLCWMSFPLQAQYVVQGVVTDSLTREPLPYTSVYLKGTTEGGMTDDKGQFSFKTYRPQAVLVISAIGYNEYTRLIHPAQGIRLTIALSPATYALNEVVVKPKRERYKKKDNPAVEFVRQMIEHRDDYSPKELDFWQRDRYEKMTFAINNFDSVKQQKWLYRKFKFLTDYVDTSAVTGKPVLAVSNRELLATDYYRKSPKSQKQRVHARRQAGVDEMLSQQGMEQAISVTMTDVDIYENNITLFTNKFVSPLSSLGPSFYKYYLMDTLTIAGQPCVDLTFVPFNSESFGFTGHLYVTLDSTYFVRRATMNFPQKINLNFVDYMSLEQNFTRGADGTRQLVDEHITTEFKLVDNSDGIYAKRDVYYRNYVYEPSADALSAFKKPEKVIEPAEATHRTEAYWDDNRQVEVSKKETSVDKMMAQLRTYPVYYWTEKTLKVLFTGYIPAPKEKEPLFYIGMMNTTISGNTLEGVRLRAERVGVLHDHADRSLGGDGNGKFQRSVVAQDGQPHRVAGMELQIGFVVAVVHLFVTVRRAPALHSDDLVAFPQPGGSRRHDAVDQERHALDEEFFIALVLTHGDQFGDAVLVHVRRHIAAQHLHQRAAALQHQIRHHARYAQFAAGQHIITDGQFFIDARIQRALIHALVVAADQDKMVILCLQFTGHLLGQHPAAGGHIDGVDPLPRFIADMLPAAVQRICLHDRAAAAAVGIVIHLHLLVGGVVPYLVGLYGDKAPFPGTTDDGRTHHSFHRVGEQGHDVNSHRWPVLSSCVRE